MMGLPLPNRALTVRKPPSQILSGKRRSEEHVE